MFKVSLKQCNPYVPDFIQICDLNECAKVVIKSSTRNSCNKSKAKPINEHRRVHNVNLNELARVSDETASSDDVLGRKRGGDFQKFLIRTDLTTHFILFFYFQWPLIFGVFRPFFRNSDQTMSLQRYHCFLLNEICNS